MLISFLGNFFEYDNIINIEKNKKSIDFILKDKYKIKFCIIKDQLILDYVYDYVKNEIMYGLNNKEISILNLSVPADVWLYIYALNSDLEFKRNSIGIVVNVNDWKVDYDYDRIRKDSNNLYVRISRNYRNKSFEVNEILIVKPLELEVELGQVIKRLIDLEISFDTINKSALLDLDIDNLKLKEVD